MAAPTFVAAGTVADAASGNFSPGEPAGIAADDVLLLCIEDEPTSDAAFGNPDSGDWTLVGYETYPDSPTSAASDSRITVYRHTYDGVTSPTYTCTVENNHAQGVVLAYRGVDTDSPIDGTQASRNGDNINSMTADGVTTSVDECLVVLVTALGDGRTPGYADLSNSSVTFTERVDNNTAQGQDGTLFVLDGEMTSAGDTGNTTATLNSTNHASLSIGLTPAPSGPSGTDYRFVARGRRVGVRPVSRI